jgi:hypothetical protein
MIALLLAASPAIALVLVVLIVVVVGIRHEPSTVELRSQPPSRLAALVRRLLGVSVRRPDPHATDDETPESCFAGRSSWPDRR